MDPCELPGQMPSTTNLKCRRTKAPSTWRLTDCLKIKRQVLRPTI